MSAILTKNLRLFKHLRPLFLLKKSPPLLLAVLPLRNLSPSLSNIQRTKLNTPESISFLDRLAYILRLTLRILYLTWIWCRFAFRVWVLRISFSKALLQSIEDSGSIFVKLGQWASTRRDLFSPDLIQTLSKLQRNVNTVHPWYHTQYVLNKYFDSNIFESIHTSPIGTGCCAQVYKGTLASSKKRVAIKVLHPNIKENFKMDLFFLRSICSFLEWMVPDLTWLSSGEFITEFTGSMMKQMDLSLEAQNLKVFRNNFKGESKVRFPEPMDGMCFEDVLVEEFIDGLSISTFLEGSPSSLKASLAKKGVDIFFCMLFRHNFVHGDLHPGNILVSGDDELVVLDPGIATSLLKTDLANLRSVFKAVIQGDGESVGRLFLERSSHQCEDPKEFVREINAIVHNAIRDGELSLARVEVTKLLNSVFDAFRNHKVKLDSSFSMVIISIIVIEGLGKSLDPNLNLLDSAWPYFM